MRPYRAHRPHRQRGFTLVELMVSLVVGSLISLAAVAAFLSHSRMIYNQMTYNQAAEDVSEAYVLLSRLIQQAQRDSITISGMTTVGTCATDITVDLAVPRGFPVWPNMVSPFDKNWVRVVLSSTGNNPHTITLAHAPSGGLGTAPAIPFAGSNSGNNTKITCMSLSAQADGTYAFSLAGYARNFDAGDVAFEGVILPRN